MFAILRKALNGGTFGFTLNSDEVPNERQFANINAAKDENGRSRIYLGVHFEFDNREGKALGEQVASLVWDNFLRPIN
jgi:hypothetical protein